MNYCLKRLIIFLFSTSILGCASVAPETTTKWVGYTEIGKASFYGDQHQLKKTASGELYNHDLKTVAHRNIPFGSTLRVTNTDNGKSIVAKVNDRGPFVEGRIIDLSKSAFETIGNSDTGVISVEIVVLE